MRKAETRLWSSSAERRSISAEVATCWLEAAVCSVAADACWVAADEPSATAAALSMSLRMRFAPAAICSVAAAICAACSVISLTALAIRSNARPVSSAVVADVAERWALSSTSATARWVSDWISSTMPEIVAAAS